VPLLNPKLAVGLAASGVRASGSGHWRHESAVNHEKGGVLPMRAIGDPSALTIS
jgi:hypothetical protein